MQIPSRVGTSRVKQIIESRCVMCHNEQASGIPDVTKYEQLKALTVQDEGATFSSLIRVSHIHLFGISFIFMFVGILSWWLTKMNPMFAWLVILAGAGMTMSFAFMWLVSFKEMWFLKETEPLAVEGEREMQLDA